jgi:hypothetical protein
MGRIIQKNNGKTTVFVTGENFNSLPILTNTYYVGVDLSSGYFEKLNPSGSVINLESGGSTFTGGTVSGATNFTDGLSANTISATTYYNLPGDIYITGGTYSNGTLTLNSTILSDIFITGFTGNVVNTTYQELGDAIATNTLSAGTYYNITDFQTVYDQPDFFIDGNQKNTVVTFSGSVEPIIVLATSENSISIDAYQPLYPFDKITYDGRFNSTEIMGQPAYGRISERIDEFNNRTDYDHRNIEFRRYGTHIKDSQLPGTIYSYDCNTGLIVGVGTSFNGLSVDQILIFDSKNLYGYDIGVKIINIIDDLNIEVAIDPDFTSINFTNLDFNFYTDVNIGYFSYKETYVGQSIDGEFNTYPTFELNGDSLSNYIGNYSNFYDTNYSNSGFLLANNVFYGNTYSNKIGDRSYNNTANNWFLRNTISGRFYNNIITSGLYSNDISEYFTNNQIYGQFYANEISEGFDSNVINGVFYQNKIKNYFYYNKVGNEFGGNDIASNFNGNNLSDYFTNNSILDNFAGNTISDYFAYNIIGNNFGDNIIDSYFGVGSGEPQGNIIGDNFISNEIGNYFYNNKVGNYFTDNIIGVEFENNNIQNYFVGNSIGDNFISNEIGNYFGNNGNLQNVIFNDFKFNKIGNYFGNNTNYPTDGSSAGDDGGNIINDGFKYNVIGSDFNTNQIGNLFNNNNVSTLFSGNTIADNFQRNQIEYSPNSIDFTTGPSTHVYGDYSCVMFKRPDGTLRLSYYDNSDVLNITDIDA